MYGKIEGKANTENKYDFPPPVDTKLFFGSCLLLAKTYNEQNIYIPISLTIPLWDIFYEKLFGGFEDLHQSSALEDEEEIDELDNIPKSKKTKKGGYLKDGFVVDSDEDECSFYETESESDVNDELETMEEEVINIEDIGSELSEEAYEYVEEE